MEKAIFLDKDGTLVDNWGYPEIIPTDDILEGHILQGLKHAQEKGYKMIIISNQPWIAKGKMTKKEVENVFKNLISKLEKKGIKIDDYFYCPHQSLDNCECKKPKPSMIFQAAKKHNINLSQSFMVGDSDFDIAAGKNARVKTALVLTGNGKNFLNTEPDYILQNINELKNILWPKQNLIAELKSRSAG
jgi:D,D-heptose 1,7-bisphosphate phosphatase